MSTITASHKAQAQAATGTLLAGLILVDKRTLSTALSMSSRTFDRRRQMRRIPPPVNDGLSEKLLWSVSEIREWVSAGCPSVV